MALWTDIVDPATLTGYTRASLADYEARKGTLARWLPNQVVSDIVVRFTKGANGLTPIAEFRAYDAEPKMGAAPEGQRVTIELPALGQNIPVSEYNQLRARNGNMSDAALLNSIEKTADQVARAVSDAIERLRGIVLVTGKATITNFMDDDFGRAAGHTVTAGASWATGSTNALSHLETWSDTYTAANGEAPGAILTSTRVVRLMAGLDQFKTQLLNSASRPATVQDVQDYISAAGLPPIYTYDRNIKIGTAAPSKVIADDKLILLPAPVDPNDEAGTELGGTVWGQTLSSTDAGWNIEDSEQPGLVTGVYRGEKPPMIAEVLSDAIALPFLANPDLSFVADVIP